VPEGVPLIEAEVLAHDEVEVGVCCSYIGSLQLLRTGSDKVFYATIPQTLVGPPSTFKIGVVCLPTFPTGFIGPVRRLIGGAG